MISGPVNFHMSYQIIDVEALCSEAYIEQVGVRASSDDLVRAFRELKVEYNKLAEHLKSLESECDEPKDRPIDPNERDYGVIELRRRSLNDVLHHFCSVDQPEYMNQLKPETQREIIRANVSAAIQIHGFEFIELDFPNKDEQNFTLTIGFDGRRWHEKFNTKREVPA